MLGLMSRDCPSHVLKGSILGTLIFLVIPSLLFIPVLYYSLTTPFGLVDDYQMWQYILYVFNDSFLDWLNYTFLNFSDRRTRYRPFWEIHNAITWSLFGATPWAHHLSRWILHFGTVFIFVAAFRCFSQNQRQENSTALTGREKFDHLLPLAFLIYVWVFFPNSPGSRLGPQEIHTAFFLGLCTYMTALILCKKNGKKRASSSLPQYVIFHMSYAGLCWSKEINGAAALWILIFYCVFLVSGNVRKKLMASIPLALILFHTLGMVYVASKTFGVGYASLSDVPSQPFDRNAIKILKGLFQIETSLIITVGFATLSAILLLFVIIRIANRSLKGESLFVLFLLGQFMSLFSALSLSYDVVLRYWYVLLPVFATLLAFSVEFTLKSIRKESSNITYGVVAAVIAVFVVFFVAVNYYNFLFQTTIQHSLRNADSRLISEILRLVDRGEYVSIDNIKDEPEQTLHSHLPHYLNYIHHRNCRIHTHKPETDRDYFFVSRKSLPPGFGERLMTIVPRSNYRLPSFVSKIAGALQGAPAFLHGDAGVHHPHLYQWAVYRPTGERFISHVLSDAYELLIHSQFRVYFNRTQSTLSYVKESCRKEDLRALFFLHIIPVDIEDLPELSKEYGFENMDFPFHAYGTLHEGECVATLELPDYPIHQILTGQYIDEARLWEGSIWLDK